VSYFFRGVGRAIGSRDGFDKEILQEKFDACIGTGDDSRSPVLRLVKKLHLIYLKNKQFRIQQIHHKISNTYD